MSAGPWSEFRVGTTDEPNRFRDDCKALTSVAHVAHVPVGLRIVEDKQLRADLVFDRSKLNTERIRVVWLSPNDWDNAGGFRYGNVRFHFDWAKLIEGKRSYWVESVAYGIPACRILITEADYASSLEPYDPTQGDGPWWQAPSGKHYWNGEFTLEVMYEGDLDLSLVTGVDFVQHHKNYCSIDYHTCRFRGVSDAKGGAEFIAGVVSRHRPLDLPGMVTHPGRDQQASWSLGTAVTALVKDMRELDVGRSGAMKQSDPGAHALALAALGAYANQDIDGDLRELAGQFASVRDLEGAVIDVVAAAAGLADLKPFA